MSDATRKPAGRKNYQDIQRGGFWPVELPHVFYKNAGKEEERAGIYEIDDNGGRVLTKQNRSYQRRLQEEGVVLIYKGQGKK